MVAKGARGEEEERRERDSSPDARGGREGSPSLPLHSLLKEANVRERLESWVPTRPRDKGQRTGRGWERGGERGRERGRDRERREKREREGEPCPSSESFLRVWRGGCPWPWPHQGPVDRVGGGRARRWVT